MVNAPVYLHHRYPPNHRDIWGFGVHGMRLRETLERILPFMGERRARKIIDVLSMPTWGFSDTLNRRAANARAAKQRRVNEEAA